MIVFAFISTLSLIMTVSSIKIVLGNSNFNIFAYMPDKLYNRLVTAPKRYATDPNYENKMNRMYKSVLATIS